MLCKRTVRIISLCVGGWVCYAEYAVEFLGCGEWRLGRAVMRIFKIYDESTDDELVGRDLVEFPGWLFTRVSTLHTLLFEYEGEGCMREMGMLRNQGWFHLQAQ